VSGGRQKRNKIKRVRARDGDNCWLCCMPIDFTLPYGDLMCVSLDHYVPRKWGGKNGEPNMKLAHATCNSQREKLFPETMIFTNEEILRLTNPSQANIGMSKKAKKAMKHRLRVEGRGASAIVRDLRPALTSTSCSAPSGAGKALPVPATPLQWPKRAGQPRRASVG
jgi:hypothetical protein